MKAVVLAAGKGKRLLSEKFLLPKALRELCGKPLIGHVLENTGFIKPEDTVIVVGFRKEAIIERFEPLGYRFAVQEQQLGTGHAAACAEKELENYDGPVLICYGDMPLMKRETFEAAVAAHNRDKNDCTIITGISDGHLAYGRIIRDGNGNFVKVVEDADCTPEQKKIKELNIGLYVFDSKKLFATLRGLKNNNAQGEYYLTDVPYDMIAKGMKIGTYTVEEEAQIFGVNTPEELEYCERILRERNSAC